MVVFTACGPNAEANLLPKPGGLCPHSCGELRSWPHVAPAAVRPSDSRLTRRLAWARDDARIEPVPRAVISVRAHIKTNAFRINHPLRLYSARDGPIVERLATVTDGTIDTYGQI